MKKVYLIYASIPSILFDNKIHDFVHDSSRYHLNNGYYTGLYAWTTHKNLLNEFLEFRVGAKSIYKIKQKEFTKEEYNIFKSDNSYEKLNYYTFYNEIDDEKTNVKSDSSVICTKEEYEEMYEYGEQYMIDYMSQLVTVDYIVFKDKYKLLLDSVGYCDLFNKLHDGYDDNTDSYDPYYYDRHELTDFNNSYGLSYYGNHKVDICENKLGLFINIYYEMIVGFDFNSEIKLLIYR